MFTKSDFTSSVYILKVGKCIVVVANLQGNEVSVLFKRFSYYQLFSFPL